MLAQAGPLYLAGAAVLGLGFLATTLAFHLVRDIPRARLVLRASLVYLPALLLVLLLDRALFTP
jgi:protoheme IX farnesyltransferase